MKLSALPIPAAPGRDDAAELSIDEVAIIFGFLTHVDIMRARVCSTWREAAKKTLVPWTDFDVDSLRSYNAMRAMSTALPNLQQISICRLDYKQRFIDGEDPSERIAAATASWTAHDINIVSNFRKLRKMSICEVPLNGRYPVLFNFPLIRVLHIQECGHLKFDLEMLGGLPSLEELDCISNPCLTGNLRSLRARRDTLERVEIIRSGNIKGNFMDLADFPRLRELNLCYTGVTGDIRDISGNDFPALESISLPKTVAGGKEYEFQHISEVPSFMHTIHLLMQRKKKVTIYGDGFDSGWGLSPNSPDWYAGTRISDDHFFIHAPPFRLQILQAGSRLGWSWYAGWNHNLSSEVAQSCEINWLDTEPSSESDDYTVYTEEMENIEIDIGFYRGYYEHPPNEHQYRRLCYEWDQRG